MIKEGDELFFEEDGQIYSGKVVNLTETTFELDSYGCCCEGNCIIQRSMIGHTFFINKDNLEKRLSL